MIAVAILWTEIFLPVIGFALLFLQRKSGFRIHRARAD